MSDNYKIYGLSSSSDSSNIRYVGRTKLNLDKRLYYHLKSIKYENSHKSNWIKFVLKNNDNIILTELHNNLNEEQSKFKEIEFIKKFKEEGFKLTNGTDGGDGLSMPTKETIEKISKTCKERWKNRIPYNKGKTFEELFGLEKSLYLKEKSSKEQLGKKIPNEQRKKSKDNHAKYWLGKKLHKEHAEKLKDGLRKANLNPYFQKNRTKNMIKPVVQMDLNGNVIKEWNSIKEAADILKINKSNIGECCNMKRKTSGNFMWKFIKKEI